MTQYVYDFSEGGKDDKELLGGKGANLAEMTSLGLPVPPGFTITTQACRAYLADGCEPDGMADQVAGGLAALEERMQRRLGDGSDPLLVSVRSGAKFSMPGMMDTVLNVGLTDDSVHALAARAGDDRFAWDSYRRLIQMYGETVMGIEGRHFTEVLDAVVAERESASEVDLEPDELRGLVDDFKKVVRRECGEDFPQDPHRQLDMTIRAVFESWNTERARLYRRQERIPDDLGTAVSVVSMVFGNNGQDSGTGVAFTRDPATGEQGVYGDYLPNAQGEDVVAGIRNTLSLTELADLDAASYDQLLDIMATLERHYRDLCDVEFTIERGQLWMLQTRVGKRTAAAAFRIARALVDEGLIDDDEALSRVTGAHLAQLMFPQFDPAAERTSIARGMGASPGAAAGKVAFDSATAVEWANNGDDVILVRRETSPDDLGGMTAAQGILTSRGGRTSHAAVVARGMGRTCVVGVEALRIDPGAYEFAVEDGTRVGEGDVISIDGGTGDVYLGTVPVVPSAVADALYGDDVTEGTDDVSRREIVDAVMRFMRHADQRRRMDVRANADTGDDARKARALGAGGIGLCRTEHMFLGSRRKSIERVIVARTDEQRHAGLEELRPHQRADFTDILEAMDGLPVTIRLLDPPLHEFLPDLTELSVRVAVAEAEGTPDSEAATLLSEVRRLHEQNPMLGMRGVRLGLAVPELFRLQIRAIAEATAELRGRGLDPQPEIMVPLVGAVQELEAVRDMAEATVAEVADEFGIELSIPIGTMIELPRAAMTAHQIAEAAEFFSFGTNDLTQTAWGFSRDDVEASFFPDYLKRGIFGVSPFESVDVEGVGRLVSIAAWEGRETRPELQLGVCGEHGGDPDSIHFFESIKLDYVSCSPLRVPVARLEAGRAALPRR